MPNTAADADALHVAVAVICNSRDEVLLTRRHRDSHQGGLWEFPGGKVERGEALADALHRELLEELAIETLAHEPLMVIRHDYEDRSVILDVHRVTAFRGEPDPQEGQPMSWVPLADLSSYEFPAANVPIVERVQALANSP